jgi:HEAT repeat protein
MFRSLIVLALATAAAAASFDEEFAQRQASLDRTSADQVFELGNWCLEQGKVVRARELWNQAIRIDKDHEGARAALGFVRQGDRWVSGKFADKPPASGGGTAPAGGGQPRAGGPGPAAKDVPWDLAVPRDPRPADTFITAYIQRMNSLANDSTDMEVAINTLADNYLDVGIPRLCQAMLDPSWRDLAGASGVILRVSSPRTGLGSMEPVRALLPFLVKASERVTDADDLAAFCYAIGGFRDKRTVPRLVELLDFANKDVQDAAAEALAQVTFMPRKSINAGSAKAWWDRYHATPDRDIFLGMVRDSDPAVVIGAAEGLAQFRDAAIGPALVKVLRSDERQPVIRAIELVKRITGQDWGLKPGPAADRKKQVDNFDKWWRDEGSTRTWPEDARRQAAEANAPKPKTDPATRWVADLGSVTGQSAATAEQNLRAAGVAAVPALLTGLESPNQIVRVKAYDLLKVISKQSLAFDPRAPDEARKAQVQAWKAWAEEQGLLGGTDEEGAGEAGK